MNTRLLGTRSAALIVGAAFILSPAYAQEKVKVGDKMPDFTLTDLEGKKHSLADYKDKIVVLDFRSQNCPWSRGTDETYSELTGKYGDKGVVFLGVEPDATTDVAKIKDYAAKTGLEHTILKDTENHYADAVNATRTPEIYIIQNGVLKFHGAFDNRTVPEKPGETNYVAQALDELLAGKEVSTPSVSAWGCTIKRVAKKAA